MRSSGSSSATEINPPSATASPRRSFALTGRSSTLDPRTHAVRPDLADIRLAGQVFAPHYAAPFACRIERATPLLLAREGGEVVRMLEAGAPFEVLDLAGQLAWGRAPEPGLVGYVDRHALGDA